MLTISNAIALYLFLILLTGCNTAPIKLTSEYNAPDKIYSKNYPPHPNSIQCRLNVLKIEDQRKNKQTMGPVGSRYVYYNNLVEWLENGFNSFNNIGLVTFVKKEYMHENEDIDMVVVVKKAYIRSNSTSKSSTLVLDVRYFNNDEALGKNIYRGSYTNVNWASSESEVKQIFNISLAQILSDISVDVISYCGKIKGENLDAELHYFEKI